MNIFQQLEYLGKICNTFFLLYLFFILTPPAIFLAIKFHKWKYYNHYLFLVCIYDLICSSIACFQDSQLIIY